MSQFTNLNNNQLKMAESIAQYDVEAAARYRKIVSAKNQMKCPFCGSELIRSGGSLDNYICSRYRRGRHV